MDMSYLMDVIDSLNSYLLESYPSNLRANLENDKIDLRKLI